MNQLMTNDIQMTSLDIAEVIGKRHADIMRDIRKEEEELGLEIAQRIFTLGSYKDKNNQDRPCYHFGKDGAMQLALKYDAKTRYNVIQYLEKLERQPRVLTTKEQITASMKLSIEANETLEHHDERLTYLEDHMRIDGIQEKRLQNKAKSIAIESLGGMNSNAYKKSSRKVFSGIWRDFNNHFDLPRYGELPRKKYEDGLRFLSMWQPNTSLRIEINELNRQQSLEGVI